MAECTVAEPKNDATTTVGLALFGNVCVGLLTMMTGTNRVLLCARVGFADQLSAGRLERVCARLAGQLRGEFDELDEIFLQPASRSDARFRQRVQDRSGTALADR